MLGLVFTACQSSKKIVRRPNVLLIIIDTLRADELSVNLENYPNLNRFSNNSVRFSRAISASAYTAPSHASIMTSHYPREHSIGYGNGTTRLSFLPTLAEQFKQAGYRTAAFVSNFVLRIRIGLTRGFTFYDEELPSRETNRPWVRERIAESTVERALTWAFRKGNQPFFMWVHLQDPHGPYTPPRRYQKKNNVTLTKNTEKKLKVLKNHYGFKGIPAYQALPGLQELHAYRKQYQGEIAYVDEALGHLLSQLKKRFVSQPLLVLLTSDHGEAFGENEFYFAHGHATTPDQCHVPFLLKAPGLKSQNREETVSHVDILPTLTSLAGLPTLPTAHGIALGAYLKNNTSIPKRPVLCDIGYELGVYQESAVYVVGHPNKTMAQDNAFKSAKQRSGKLFNYSEMKQRKAWKWDVTGLRHEQQAPGELIESAQAYFQSNTINSDDLDMAADEKRTLEAIGYLKEAQEK